MNCITLIILHKDKLDKLENVQYIKIPIKALNWF